MGQWGAENIEQSIRTWRCGGEIKLARTSKISHLFRPRFPYQINASDVQTNKLRTLLVWFDEPYRSKVIQNLRIPMHSLDVVKRDPSIREREELKEKLKCKSFD